MFDGGTGVEDWPLEPLPDFVLVDVAFPAVALLVVGVPAVVRDPAGDDVLLPPAVAVDVVDVVDVEGLGDASDGGAVPVTDVDDVGAVVRGEAETECPPELQAVAASIKGARSDAQRRADRRTSVLPEPL